MKKWLQENLPLSAKLALKRLLVGVVGAPVRLAASAYNFGARLLAVAAKHGLNLQEAWNVAPQHQCRPSDAPNAPQLPAALSVQDFLFLSAQLSGAQQQQQRRESDPEQTPPPTTSIIIPVFNKVEFTFQCLRSLLREIDFDETEVIIVNNASTDETARLLAHFQGLVTVINNAENRGFVEASNQGAAAARGRYLVFLNNDTVVLPGWLKALRETVEGDEGVGAVGSMFLYEDGRTIQEAGAGVWQNGAAFHYGWGGSPDDRRYNFAREVDYCSGASLLVRHELFERLGGFDRRYAPAYYEDVDICFGVRSLGFKVVYQPASRIIHYEGATAGHDTTTGFKRYQALNRAKFVEKWREVLERENLPEDKLRTAEAANRSRAPRVIVFDERIPTPDRDAGSARMLFILKSLGRWSRPVFVPLNRPHGIEYERLLWKEGIETAHLIEYPRLLRTGNFHAAILSRPLVADALMKPLRRAQPSLKIVLDMVDAYFIRLAREHRITNDARVAEEAQAYREIELRLARASDLVWCASSEDKKTVAREVPGARIEVIPTIHPLQARGQGFAERSDLLFLGNFAHRPNADAVHYFAREIFPLVKEALPRVKLHLVGDNVTPEIAACGRDDVLVLGYVPDVGPLYRSCRLMVVPLRYGAGIKGKLGEALSYSLPVVTTSIGAEGFGLTDGVEALIADEPRAFAAAVVRAYEQEDLWQRLAEHGYRHIEKYYTPEVVAEVINSSVRELGPARVEKQAANNYVETNG